MKFLWLPVYFLIMLTVSSCNNDEPETPVDGDEQIIEAYLDSLSSTPFERGEDGIYYRQLTSNPPGASVPEYGDILTIQYTLSLLGGNVFTSATDTTGSDSLVVVRQGVGAIYPVGLDLALDTMRQGEQWQFILPSKLAYGDLELVNIPAGAILLVHINLLKVRDEGQAHDDEIIRLKEYVEQNLKDTINPVQYVPQGFGMGYKRTRIGNGSMTPQAGDTVKITCSISNFEGDPIDIIGSAVEPFEFIVDGEPAVFSGLNTGVKLMTSNEEAILIVPSAAAYVYSVAVIPNYIINYQVVPPEDNPLISNKIIPPYAAYVRPYETLLVEIHLRSVNN